MKTILRNFLSVLRRFRLATLLNILGLSVAFLSFMVLIMQLNYDKTFDHCHPGIENIFRIEKVDNDSRSAVICRPLTRMFAESSPHIVESGLLMPWGGNMFFYIHRQGSKVGCKEPFYGVTPSIPKLMEFSMIEGTQTALEDPHSVIIPQSMAHKLFGNSSVVGQQFTFDSPNQNSLTIKGIYKDFPRNSSMQNVIYGAIDPKENYDQWNNWNYICYVRLDDSANKEVVKENFEQVMLEKSPKPEGMPENLHLDLTSLSQLHFTKGVVFDNIPKASEHTMLVLSAISIIILLIAGINFTNFSTALTPMRVKSINTQKVLGSSNLLLRASLVIEAILIALLAYVIAVGLLNLLGKTSFTSIVDPDISIVKQLPVVLGTGIVALAVGMLAGIYPALYTTSFSPALVLKGSFGLSPKGRKLRSILISVQFISSFALIIGALFMFLQNHYMQHAPMGYDRDEIIISDMTQKTNKSREALTEELKSFAGISNVAYAQNILSSKDSYMTWGRMYKDRNIGYTCLPVSSSFIDVMGITITGGRGYIPEDDLKDHGLHIFNEKARKAYELELNTKIDNQEIVGFMEDVKFASFRQEVSPMAFLVWGKNEWNGTGGVYFSTAYIKIKAGTNIREAMDHIQRSMNKFDPDYPFRVRMYDEILQQTYEKELRVGSQITLSSLVAIFICIVGVFGLVMFDSEYRRREISLRKVLGSTVVEILLMFNRYYLSVIGICFVIAAPIAYAVTDNWLENFAYRTPMYWWVFALALGGVILITGLTVTVQNWNVANENPVKNLKEY